MSGHLRTLSGWLARGSVLLGSGESPHYRVEWVVLGPLDLPIACPATTNFPAGAVGPKTEGEKIGQCRSFPAPEN